MPGENLAKSRKKVPRKWKRIPKLAKWGIQQILSIRRVQPQKHQERERKKGARM